MPKASVAPQQLWIYKVKFQAHEDQCYQCNKCNNTFNKTIFTYKNKFLMCVDDIYKSITTPEPVSFRHAEVK